MSGLAGLMALVNGTRCPFRPVHVAPSQIGHETCGGLVLVARVLAVYFALFFHEDFIDM